MDDTPETTGFVSVAEMSRQVNISPMAVYRLLHNGTIPYHRIGRLMRVRRADWNTYLASTRQGEENA